MSSETPPGGRMLFKCWAFSDAVPARFCTFCELRPAIRLCDAQVMRDGRAATCDNALCAECSRREGRKDFCPEHQARETAVAVPSADTPRRK